MPRGVYKKAYGDERLVASNSRFEWRVRLLTGGRLESYTGGTYGQTLKTDAVLVRTLRRTGEERWIEKRSATVAETSARFREICTDAADSGDIRRTVANLPKRLKLVIEAEGGPIRY